MKTPEPPPPICPRCARPRFTNKEALTLGRVDNEKYCVVEWLPDQADLRVVCNRLWAERVEKDRDEAIGLLRRVQGCTRLSAHIAADEFLARFPETT